MIRLFWLMLGLAILITACDLSVGGNTATELPTPTPSSTPASSPTPESPFHALPSQTPYVPCPAAPETRLIVQERGRVTESEETLNLRAGPGIDYQILIRIEPLAVFFVLDGPVCADNYVWYRVLADEQEGWFAEGEFEQYYTEPYLPG